ncbi:hypothetical protein [Litorisediminicola beolgyonensis]|uniref:Uncharacterized protein n=1 Tax=Litorisediminicola beolgyonensis TaxID=1173614 RepID=A0ABW3ZG25_9RHOB
MHRSDPILRLRQFRGFPLVLACLAAIAAAGLIRYDMITHVEHSVGRVEDVLQLPGGSMAERLVVVSWGQSMRRALPTGDPLLHLRTGDRVCIASRRYLLRRWTRHAIVLPGFCRDLREALARRPLPSYDLQTGTGRDGIHAGWQTHTSDHRGGDRGL